MRPLYIVNYNTIEAHPVSQYSKYTGKISVNWILNMKMVGNIVAKAIEVSTFLFFYSIFWVMKYSAIIVLAFLITFFIQRKKRC